jgi:hypothetical protein
MNSLDNGTIRAIQNYFSLALGVGGRPAHAVFGLAFGASQVTRPLWTRWRNSGWAVYLHLRLPLELIRRSEGFGRFAAQFMNLKFPVDVPATTDIGQ